MSLFQDIAKTFSEQNKLVWDFTIYNLKHPSFTNIYYCVFMAYALCFFLEVILPKQRQHGLTSRKGFWLDTFYVLFNDILLYLFGFFALCAVTELVTMKVVGLFGVKSLMIWDARTLNPIVQVLIMFVLQDFMEFLAHFFLHRSDFLWAFHKIHHAQEELGAASTRHFHWVEMMVFKPLVYIPFALIGYSVADYYLFQITVQNVWGFFTHSNIKVRWGFLNYIVNTPETHAWHHAKNVPGKYGVNYASILNIWDLMFGFYYLPKDKAPVLGIPDQKEIPTTFFGQMMYPFRLIASGKYKSTAYTQSNQKNTTAKVSGKVKK